MMKVFKSSIYLCLLAAFVLGVMTGCKENSSARKFNSTDITGAEFGTDFRLTDHTGKIRTRADFKGKVASVGISFGLKR